MNSKTETPIPPLPCPNCGENILEKGWYNSCSETVSLREDNYPVISGDHFYMEHGEDDHETTDHECDSQAYCTSCNTLLPWTTFEIRDLDGSKIADLPQGIADLVEQAKR